MRRLEGGGALVALLVMVVSTIASPAAPAAGEETSSSYTSYEEPQYVPWSSVLPALEQGFERSSLDVCRSGKSLCVDSVIRTMTRRFQPLADACDHDAIFALSYLRTTQVYRHTIDVAGFFADTAFLNHLDVLFARYYFDAFDAWHAGRVLDTPRAWQIAFDAADGRKVRGTGNLLLGINAHVNRDLPFVWARLGLRDLGGNSRKPDHDKVNEFLNQVTAPLLHESDDRFDHTMNDTYERMDDGNEATGGADGTTTDETVESEPAPREPVPAALGYTSSFQLIVAWREAAWRNAERLVGAATPEARSAVAADIEASAAATADAIVAAARYGLEGSAARDAHCALNQAKYAAYYDALYD